MNSNNYIVGIDKCDLNFKPNYTIQFRGEENKLIGVFDFGKSPPTFEGGVDESAKIFCETVLKWMPQIIEKYK
jgi:hypothetical protein